MKSLQHEPDHGDIDETFTLLGLFLIILAQAA